MTDTLNEYNQPAVSRPTFLTVLCILTFIGSGYGLISSSIQYFTADRQSANIASVRQQVNTEMEKVDTLNSGGTKIATQLLRNAESAFTPANIKKGALANLLSCVFCLLGAFLMWALNKNGFYLYIVGTLIGIIIPFVLFGNNLLAIGSSAFIGFFGVVFIVLYGINLKYMK